MADLPILFSGPMVRAIMREIEQPGTGKTQTRRVIKPQPIGPLKGGEHLQGITGMYYVGDTIWPINFYTSVVSNKPGPHPEWVKEHVKIAVGDRLYVREAWRCNGWATDVATIFYRASESDGYTAMCEQYPVDDKKFQRVTSTWRPGIHMPRWASRITLIISDVRVERLQDISEADAIAEGIAMVLEDSPSDTWFSGIHGSTDLSAEGLLGWHYNDAAAAYRDLWDGINGDRPGCSWAENPWVVAYTFRPIFGNIDQVQS